MAKVCNFNDRYLCQYLIDNLKHIRIELSTFIEKIKKKP